jgi:hypothetical protein
MPQIQALSDVMRLRVIRVAFSAAFRAAGRNLAGSKIDDPLAEALYPSVVG